MYEVTLDITRSYMKKKKHSYLKINYFKTSFKPTIHFLSALLQSHWRVNKSHCWTKYLRYNTTKLEENIGNCDT